MGGGVCVCGEEGEKGELCLYVCAFACVWEVGQFFTVLCDPHLVFMF